MHYNYKYIRTQRPKPDKHKFEAITQQSQVDYQD